MIDLLRDHPVLLLFAVLAVGYLLGEVRLGGFRLGAAAVLFAGLGFGALAPDLELPEIVYVIGLVLFVYCVGLASGPGFVAALRRRGVAANAAVAAVLVGAALLTLAIAAIADLSAPTAAGLFAGSLTNTPALAAVLDTLRSGSPTAQVEPVIAYSVAYPIGVLGMLGAVVVAERWWGRSEPDGVPADEAEPLMVASIEVTRDDVAGIPATRLIAAKDWRVTFGRHRTPDGTLTIVDDTTSLRGGDVVNVIGPADAVEEVVAFLGRRAAEPIELDRRVLDTRRILVSDPKVAGRRIAELGLSARFGATATRVRRGDVDLLAEPDLVLELGDRVRVVAPRDRINDLTAFFGDSYRAVSEIDVASFALGVVLGLLIGMIRFPLPGGNGFELGLAGGPLLVGLVLANVGRTGPIVWQLPYSANLTLRQLGIVLFLAGVGTRSGYEFVSTLTDGGALPLFLGGVIVTGSAALALLAVGRRWLRVSLPTLMGMLGGLQTQPAVLSFAVERSGDERPNVGYATVYPVAMVVKIVLAQLLLSAMSG
jgi:putative transport protein